MLASVLWCPLRAGDVEHLLMCLFAIYHGTDIEGYYVLFIN